MSEIPQKPGPRPRTPLWKRCTWRRITNTVSHYRRRWYHLYWLPQYKRDKRREGADWNRWLRNCEGKLAATREPTDRICTVHKSTGHIGYHLCDQFVPGETTERCKMVDVVRIGDET